MAAEETQASPLEGCAPTPDVESDPPQGQAHGKRRSLLGSILGSRRHSLGNSGPPPSPGDVSAVRRLSSLRRWSNSVRRRSSSVLSSSVSDNEEPGRTPFDRDLARIARRSSNPRTSSSLSHPAAVGGKCLSPCGRRGGRIGDSVALECRNFAWTLRTASSRPRILLSSFLTFAIICATGLSALIVSGRKENESYEEARLDEARDMSYRIDDELKKALLPLFTMEEMARQNERFVGLPAQIEGDERGAASICSEPALLEEYDRIAASVKESANMPGVLVNVRLAPAGVVCLVHPVNNTSDFGEGAFLDSRPNIGRDLLSDPASTHYNGRLLEDGKITLEGPVKYTTGLDARLLFARESIFVEREGDVGVSFQGGGNGSLKPYNFWGFVAVVLNWDEIERQLNLHSFFEEKDMEFRLIRSDPPVDLDASDEEESIAIIAESVNSHLLDDENTVKKPLHAFDSDWVLIMGAPATSTQPWVIWGCVCVVIIALISSIALLIILVEKYEHEKLLYRMMPRKIIHKLHRGETVIEKYDQATLCFFDIVSFTTISRQMRAEEVMNMLKVLYTEFDRLAEKHQVFNVETIGDAYIVIGGGPDKCDAAEGAQKVASFALEAIEATRNLRFHDGWQIEIRAGLATGLVVAGVIGTELVPKLTLFGPTVTLGETLESSSKAMEVLCSAETCRLLQLARSHQFDMRLRDDQKKIYCDKKEIEQTFWVDRVTKCDDPKKSPVGDERPGDILISSPAEEGKGSDIEESDMGNDGSAVVDNFQDEDFTLVEVELGDSSALQNEEGAKDDRIERHCAGTAAQRASFSVVELLEGKTLGEKLAENQGSGSLSGHSSGSDPPDTNRPKGNILRSLLLRGRDRRRSRGMKSTGSGSVTSAADTDFQDYWSRLADDAWQDGSVEERRRTQGCCAPCWSSFQSSACLQLKSIKRVCCIAVARKEIIIVTSVAFAALCAAGLATVLVFAKEYEENLQELAVQKAESADRWLLNELRKSLLPLFAMAELVKNLGNIFDEMPGRIENRTILKDVRPFWWRNTTGICDDPTKLKPFNEMAASIKKRSDLQRILVNVQLAPHGVLCLTHPKNNTEDFDDGAFLDTSFAIGLDLINDPTRSAVSRATVKEDRYTIQGPIPLVQGSKSVVDEAIIARYPVRDPDHFIDIDGKEYSFWGHTVTLMDWDKLKRKFGLYTFFSKDGMEFKMTRTDTLVNQSTGEKYFKVAVIAKSELSSVLTEKNSVSVELETADNGWVLAVGYESGFSPPWKVWGCVLVVATALLLSSLLLMVLVTTAEHEMLLYRMMPRGAIKRLQRGETIVDRDSLATVFFSHINGFTTLSGQMKPADFMLMLNQIYEAFDKLTVKHEVSKIETIGACYIVTAPGPDKTVGREGAVRVALFALDAMNFVRNYRYKGKQIFIQAGITSGPVVSGVIGAALPKYTIFGDTVNFASRMDSTSKSMRIQCSEKTQQLLSRSLEFQFDLEERTENGERGIVVKGKGLKYTWWVCGAQSKFMGEYAEAINNDSNGDTKDVPNYVVSEEIHQSTRPGRRVSFSDQCQGAILDSRAVEAGNASATKIDVSTGDT